MDMNDVMALEAGVAAGKEAKSMLYGQGPDFGHVVLELTVTAAGSDGCIRSRTVSADCLTDKEKAAVARIITRVISEQDRRAREIRRKSFHEAEVVK